MTDAQTRRNRGAGRLVCGLRTKGLVVVVWLLVVAVAFPLASKLTDAQDNDAASWLPGGAESTQVSEESQGFRPEVVPAIVVDARDGGP